LDLDEELVEVVAEVELLVAAAALCFLSFFAAASARLNCVSLDIFLLGLEEEEEEEEELAILKDPMGWWLVGERKKLKFIEKLDHIAVTTHTCTH